ncbi:MAG TPA: M1 family aminopeptidase [Flavisolibacter sp.]|nr:M1 family aminopeptidase [Flavisolibacter sp.]
MKTYYSPFTLCIICLLAFVSLLPAQKADKPYYHTSETSLARVSTSGFSGTGSNIDVVYHRAEWRINPDSSAKAISGSVTTYFVTTVANVTRITFDLRKSAFDNVNLKVKYKGAVLPATSRSISTSNILSIDLGVSLPADKLDSVTIYYGGVPPAPGENGAAVGYQKGTYTASGVTQNYIYTLSESYEDRDWWPCKADMQDKIDSMDIIVSAPWTGKDTFWVASNGKLVDSSISGSSRIFTYKTRYPIASYLVSVAVARYNRYYSKVRVGDTDVPVAYYLFRGKSSTTYNSIVTAMEKVNKAVIEFSNKFGDYPFKKEKHGFYEGLGGAGGMEHQTFSAIASGSISHIPTLVHELMHQWFGDKVTFSTWHHLWLAEGFARYSESLVGELVPSIGINPITERASNRTATRSSYATTSLVIPDASVKTSGGIWNGNYAGAVYEKGAMVVSMLRKLVGDELFYKAMRNYMNDPLLAYKSATSEDLRKHFEKVANNYDLKPFFDSWVYKVGHADYKINWGFSGTRVSIQVTSQTPSTGATAAYYFTPLILKISGKTSTGANKDTTVVIYDQKGKLSFAGRGISPAVPGNGLSYNLSFTPTATTGVTFDPNTELIAGASIQYQAALNPVVYSVLPIKVIDFKGINRQDENLLALTIETHNVKKNVELQRSVDGVSFQSLGQMTEVSCDQDVTTYHSTDKDIHNAHTYYYRARLIDEQGLQGYSKNIRLVNQKRPSEVKVITNSSREYVQLMLTPEWQGRQVGITLYNSNGAVLKKEAWPQAANVIKFPVGNLSAGTYSVELVGTDRKRFLKTFIRLPY